MSNHPYTIKQNACIKKSIYPPQGYQKYITQPIYIEQKGKPEKKIKKRNMYTLKKGIFKNNILQETTIGSELQNFQKENLGLLTFSKDNIHSTKPSIKNQSALQMIGWNKPIKSKLTSTMVAVRGIQFVDSSQPLPNSTQQHQNSTQQTFYTFQQSKNNKNVKQSFHQNHLLNSTCKSIINNEKSFQQSRTLLKMAINGNYTLWNKSQLKRKSTKKAYGQYFKAQNYKKSHKNIYQTQKSQKSLRNSISFITEIDKDIQNQQKRLKIMRPQSSLVYKQKSMVINQMSKFGCEERLNNSQSEVINRGQQIQSCHTSRKPNKKISYYGLSRKPNQTCDFLYNGQQVKSFGRKNSSPSLFIAQQSLNTKKPRQPNQPLKQFQSLHINTIQYSQHKSFIPKNYKNQNVKKMTSQLQINKVFQRRKKTKKKEQCYEEKDNHLRDIQKNIRNDVQIFIRNIG